jgi:biotin transporter BioY
MLPKQAETRMFVSMTTRFTAVLIAYMPSSVKWSFFEIAVKTKNARWVAAGVLIKERCGLKSALHYFFLAAFFAAFLAGALAPPLARFSSMAA